MTKPEVTIISDNGKTPQIPTSGTFELPFDKVKSMLSSRPLRRSNRSGASPLTDEEADKLIRDAEGKVPPKEWFDEDFTGLQ